MSSIRIVHSAAPDDQPERDLHIWTPTQMKDLLSWIADRGFPRWIGINATKIWNDGDRWVSLFTHLRADRFKDTRFVLYTDIAHSDSEAPCGCSGCDSPCDYHHHDAALVADCGCSRHFKTVCAYHES